MNATMKMKLKENALIMIVIALISLIAILYS
jgi:hypothetical protein